MSENDKQAEPVALEKLFAELLKATYFGKESYYNDEQISDACYAKAFEIALVAKKKGIELYTHPAQPVQPLRYTADGALAECPCCGSLNVGGVHDTVNCYGCGLSITAPRPLKNAIDRWNQRTNKAPAVAVNEQMRTALEGLLAITRDSQGVAGYHLNGEVAKWDEFEEVSAAEVAIAAAEAHIKEKSK